jgi:MoxR-like ATPase
MEEVIILQRFHQLENNNVLEAINPVLNGGEIIQLRQLVKQIIVEEKLLQFIAKVTVATRTDKSVYLGASPRASLAILNAAKAFAAMAGRDFVIPDDVVKATTPELRHRIILTPEKEMEGTKEDEVIQRIVHSIEIPR